MVAKYSIGNNRESTYSFIKQIYNTTDRGAHRDSEVNQFVSSEHLRSSIDHDYYA